MELWNNVILIKTNPLYIINKDSAGHSLSDSLASPASFAQQLTPLHTKHRPKPP